MGLRPTRKARRARGARAAATVPPMDRRPVRSTRAPWSSTPPLTSASAGARARRRPSCGHRRDRLHRSHGRGVQRGGGLPGRPYGGRSVAGRRPRHQDSLGSVEGTDVRTARKISGESTRTSSATNLFPRGRRADRTQSNHSRCQSERGSARSSRQGCSTSLVLAVTRPPRCSRERRLSRARHRLLRFPSLRPHRDNHRHTPPACAHSRRGKVATDRPRARRLRRSQPRGIPCSGSASSLAVSPIALQACATARKLP